MGESSIVFLLCAEPAASRSIESGMRRQVQDFRELATLSAAAAREIFTHKVSQAPDPDKGKHPDRPQR
jgi:hypothetical protein